ncbi:DUF2207 domain-containing protein [bacterium]|nr:DUF2207 domain-containing protein [bacterium]
MGKKDLKVIKCLFSLFIGFFIFLQVYPPSVQAKTLAIPSVDIVAAIRQDGSVEIVENRTIRFDGDFTYGFYELPKAKTGDLTDFSIADESITYQYDSVGSKMSGTYYREDLGDTWKYYYYFQANNTTKTFTIRYVLKNVITLYQDYGEFYYKLQGTGWDYTIDSFTSKIKWETPIPMENYRIWAHGALWGEFKKTDTYSSNVTINQVPNKTMVEVRVLLPRTYFSFQPTHQDTILEKAVSEETKWADEANRERELATTRSERMKKIGNGIQLFLYVLALFLIYLFYRLYKKYGAELPLANESIYYREPPSELRPAIAGLLFSFEVYNPRFLQATILDLIRRKWIQYDEIPGNFLTRNYRMTKLTNEKDTLNEYEKILMEKILFDKNDTETIKSLKAKFNTSKTIYYYAFQSFMTQVRQDLADKGYFDKKSHSISNIILIVGILLCMSNFVLGISLSTYFFGAPRYGYLILFPVGLLFIIGHGSLKRRTQSGREEFSKWKAFKSFMSDFSNLKEYGPKSLIIWERFLVYATAFGIASVVLKALKVMAPTLPDQNSGTIIRPMMFTTGNFIGMNGLMNSLSSLGKTAQTLSRTASSSHSSGSGGGGGFSGGGGDGGGGSGGGFG